MLSEEDFDLFRQFRVKAMGDMLRNMVDDPAFDGLTFEEKIKMMLDAELSARRDRKVSKLVRQARFKQPGACIEDVVYLPEQRPIDSRKQDALLDEPARSSRINHRRAAPRGWHP